MIQMGKQRFVLVVVGAYLWVMLILFGSIAFETFVVYPNIFHDSPASLTTALEFMKVRAPSDFYPPLGFLSWVLGRRRDSGRGFRPLHRSLPVPDYRAGRGLPQRPTPAARCPPTTKTANRRAIWL